MIKVCPKCGKEYEAGPAPFPMPVCPDCALEWDEEIDAKLAEMKPPPSKNDDWYEQLGIRPRHYHCTLDNYTPRDSIERRALTVCKKMAEARRGILVLIGNNGTGKTHLAAATAKAIGAGKIYKMLEFGTFIREAYQTNSRASEQGQLDKLIAMPFFALDELEKSKYTPSEMNWLSYVIDERNERYKPTMLLGNLHPKAIHTDGKMCEKCFESVMTADILDRITEVGVICHLTGKSNRADLRGKN